MRKNFEVASGTGVQRVSVFVSACQYYYLYLDGNVLGDQVLDSPWTNFYHNRSYTTLHINVSSLQPGTHTLGLRVGQGFCAETPHDEYQSDAERSAIVQMHIHDSDGNVQYIVTDETWMVTDGGFKVFAFNYTNFMIVFFILIWKGPIRQDSTYYGELYDSRYELPGWATPSYTPPKGKWVAASTNFGVVAELHSQGMLPVKRVTL